MKHFFLIGLLLLLMTFPAHAQKDKTYGLAVLDLKAIGISESEAVALSEILRSGIAQTILREQDKITDNYTLIERSQMDKIFEEFNPYAFALFENYYMANGCFLEEGQLLRDLHKISDIPLVMVNGRYDMICPPITAYRIHRKLPKSKLIIAEASGHWMGEKNIEKALLEAMQDFE